MIKCEGCTKEAKYIVYDQPHCERCANEAIEGQLCVEVRLIEDEHANQMQRDS